MTKIATACAAVVSLFVASTAPADEHPHAYLPAGLASIDHSISTMEDKQFGWTVPWAMYCDKDRALWLNGNYPIYQEPGGTVAMRVSRDRDGWHVDASRVPSDEAKWDEGGYVGSFTPIPVASAVFGEKEGRTP